jgi:hypothetical protein
MAVLRAPTYSRVDGTSIRSACLEVTLSDDPKNTEHR